MQLFVVVCQELQMGLAAPIAHDEVRVWVIEPVCPEGHAMVCVSLGSGVHATALGVGVGVSVEVGATIPGVGVGVTEGFAASAIVACVIALRATDVALSRMDCGNSGCAVTSWRRMSAVWRS